MTFERLVCKLFVLVNGCLHVQCFNSTLYAKGDLMKPK